MRDPISKYFRVGIVAAMAYPRQWGDAAGVAMKIARDPYFDAIELNPIPAEQQKAVADILSASHMTVCCGAHARLMLNGLNPNDLDEQGRAEAEKALFAGVDEAAFLGAGGMTFLSGKWRKETRGESFRQLCKTTRAVCGYAKTKNIFVELEVFDYDIDKAALIGAAPLAAEFAAEITRHCDNFGLMVDLSHIPMTYETPEFVVRTLRPYITHFHVGNTVICDKSAEAYGDEHPRFGFPNSENDTAQLLEFLRVLKREGFFKDKNPYILSFEAKPRPDEDADTVVANCKRVLNRAWAMLEDWD